MKSKITKITIIGAGYVGSTTAYTLMLGGLASEIVLIDIDKNKVEGEIMDLNHGMQFINPVNIYSGSYSDCKDSDLIIITAGANQKKGERRIDLVERNIPIFKYIVNEIAKYNNEAILLVVTNPVDILTYITYKIAGFPMNKVLGSGTVLDTARFRFLLGQHIGIDPRNVHAYIIGEHGDTEVPSWSTTNIAGISMEKYCEICHGCKDGFSKEEIFNSVKNAAYDIIAKKGATYYAVALAVEKIVEAIIRNENSILTISSVLNGEFDINDVAISVPTVVNNTGVDRILNLPLNENELFQLKKSAASLKEILKMIKI